MLDGAAAHGQPGCTEAAPAARPAEETLGRRIMRGAGRLFCFTPQVLMAWACMHVSTPVSRCLWGAAACPFQASSIAEPGFPLGWIYQSKRADGGGPALGRLQKHKGCERLWQDEEGQKSSKKKKKGGRKAQAAQLSQLQAELDEGRAALGQDGARVEAARKVGAHTTAIPCLALDYLSKNPPCLPPQQRSMLRAHPPRSVAPCLPGEP